MLREIDKVNDLASTILIASSLSFSNDGVAEK